MKFGLIVNSQMDKLTEATKRLKQKYKYISPEQLQSSAVLTDFMIEVGETIPAWRPLQVQESLKEVLHWNSKVGPISKYIMHNISANRQDMTKNVKGQILGKLAINFRQ